MIIEVMNRQTAEQTKFDNDTIVISISNKHQENPFINHDKVFLFNFDDEESPHSNAIKESDAKHIVHVVNTLKDCVNKIVVHCGAGVSRSAGIAAALGKWLNDDDSFIFDNPKFCPNRTCYRLVLNEAMGSINENELEELFLHNEEIWKEENEII
jgi:protein tyrosine phosphatase